MLNTCAGAEELRILLPQKQKTSAQEKKIKTTSRGT